MRGEFPQDVAAMIGHKVTVVVVVFSLFFSIHLLKYCLVSVVRFSYPSCLGKIGGGERERVCFCCLMIVRC